MEKHKEKGGRLSPKQGSLQTHHGHQPCAGAGPLKVEGETSRGYPLLADEEPTDSGTG